MSFEFKGIKQAKDFMVNAVTNAKLAAAKSNEISVQMNAVIANSNDTNLHEIATSMNGTFSSLTQGALQEKFSKLFGDFANTLEAAIQANPAHKAEYGSDIQELQDAVAALRSVDLTIPVIPTPEGGGSYTDDDIRKVGDFVGDSFQALLQYFNALQSDFDAAKGQFINSLSSNTAKILEATFDDFNQVSAALTESINGLQINAQNLATLQDMFNTIGNSIGDSATAGASAKAKEVAGDQRRIEVL